MSRFLITGGCGFIGSHLVDALIENGDEVVILDKLTTGKREYKHLDAELVVGDITDYTLVEKAIADVDGVFHLAAIASVERSKQEWLRAHTVNLSATVNIFDSVSRLDKKIPVVYTSSAAVYGDNEHVPLTEESHTYPLSAYGADKLGCEFHAKVAWEVHGIPNIGLRPFNVYGPRQDASSPYSGVIALFSSRIPRGEPVTIYGTGEQVRDFVYVDEMVAAYVAAMEKCTSGYEVVQVCTGIKHSINELADIIAKISGVKANKIHEDARIGDIKLSVGDPNKMEKLLGIKAHTDLEEGLRMMLEKMKMSA